MGIVFGIGMRVVQSVHHAISCGADVGRTLRDKTAEIKHFFPGPAHGKHAVGCVTMMKKGLKKQRKIPMQGKENKDSHRMKSYV